MSTAITSASRAAIPNLDMFWPFAELNSRGDYFYLEEIDGYPSPGRANVAGHGELIMLGGYSYLGLNGHPAINAAAKSAIDHYGTGAYGARLLSGSLEVHGQLERRIADFKGTEDAIVFTSGYLANLSAISALADSNSTVFCDRLDHASIVDGCRLSGAQVRRFRHNDPAHLEDLLRLSKCEGIKLVVIDAVYSMDGDIAYLPQISDACRRHGAVLMVDEAHSIGTIGATGLGIEEHFGLTTDTIDVKMGTLSKAIPSLGGYIAGSTELCRKLKHEARGFVYSSALPASSAAAAIAALDIIRDEPEHVLRLHNNVRLFSELLAAEGLPMPPRETAIFPIICGDEWTTWHMARECQRRGVYVQAIPYPVVPKNSARLRAAVSANLTVDDIRRCAAVISECARAVNLI